jgi:transposase
MGEGELRFAAYDGSLNGPVFIDFGGRLRLCFLPRYAPELNPDEWVWKHVKHDRIGVDPVWWTPKMRLCPRDGSPMPRPRRFFPLEYKAEVVELIRTTGKSVGQVARELDLTETAVRQWVRQADLDAGRRSDGLTIAERDELRRENRDLREEREILRKAAVFFARETGHR